MVFSCLYHTSFKFCGRFKVIGTPCPMAYGTILKELAPLPVAPEPLPVSHRRASCTCYHHQACHCSSVFEVGPLVLSTTASCSQSRCLLFTVSPRLSAHDQRARKGCSPMKQMNNSFRRSDMRGPNMT